MNDRIVVGYYMDGKYEVVVNGCSEFQGSLSDCEAFIRLRNGGYL